MRARSKSSNVRAQPLDPPAVAAAPQRRPVVERVAPELALVGVRVGRRAGDDAALEQLRVRAVVGAAGGDVDRHVADEPARRARPRRRAARAHSRSKRTWSATAPRGRSAPSPRSSTRARARGSRAPRPSTRARSGRRAARARRRTPSAPCTASRGGPAGRAAASATTSGPPRRASRRTRSASAPEAAAGQRGRVQLDAAGTW